jgi:hypothetical protein
MEVCHKYIFFISQKRIFKLFQNSIDKYRQSEYIKLFFPCEIKEVNSNVINEICFVEARNDNSRFITSIRMLYSVIILIFCICVIHSLKCQVLPWVVNDENTNVSENILIYHSL